MREQSTVRDTERSSIAPSEAASPTGNRRPDRVDSFPDTTSSIAFNVVPPDSNHDRGYGTDPTWQRPTPFEMLRYGASPPPTSPSSDRSSNGSGFFSLNKVMSSNTSLSTESHPKSQSSTIRQRFSRLRLSSGTRSGKDDITMSPKSQLSIRFPGELSATDMYLQSDGDRPPPKAIVAAQRGDHAEMASLIRRRADIDHPHRQTGRTPLAVACHCGHNDVAELLIAEGAKIRTKDRKNFSPLHLAAANGHCHIIETLLDRDAEIDARGPQGKTPLRIACEHGQLDAVRVLAKRRAMIDCRDETQKTALHAASEVGDDEIATLLLQYGANKDAKDSHMRTPLHSACISGRLRVVESLINAKADLEAQEEERLTPLAAAARSGLTAVMELLLRHKASPRARSAGDFTALHWASYNSHEEAVGLLIGNKKTELDARSINGRTPLHVAAMGRSFGVIEKLVKAGASLEAECHERNHPLHYACQHATHSEVSLLLNAGAKCNVQNMAGESPLHIAVRTGALKVAKALVARGAWVDAVDNKAVRPLAIAALAGRAEITHFLLASGAAVKGATDAPVCLAASGGHVQVIQALLQHGGAVREIDAQGWEPLRRAAFAGHVEAVACLLGNGARATDLGSLTSFSFASTATTDQRQRIRDLLGLAVQTENAEYQRVTYLASAANPMNTSEYVSELPVERGDGAVNEMSTGSRRPPASPSRPPPPIPDIRQTEADEEQEDTEPYYFERESERPAPYFQPSTEPVLPPPGPVQNPFGFNPRPQYPGSVLYQPSPALSPYWDGMPGRNPVSPPSSMLSPPSSMTISPPGSTYYPGSGTAISSYSPSDISAMGYNTTGYYPYQPDPESHRANPTRSEALFPATNNMGTEVNRAELA